MNKTKISEIENIAAEASALEGSSAAYIDSTTSLITELETVNKNIDMKSQEVNVLITKLRHIQSSFANTKKNNITVIEGLKKVFEVENTINGDEGEPV